MNVVAAPVPSWAVDLVGSDETRCMLAEAGRLQLVVAPRTVALRAGARHLRWERGDDPGRMLFSDVAVCLGRTTAEERDLLRRVILLLSACGVAPCG